MVHLHHQIQNYTNTEIEKYRNTNRIVDDSPPPPPPAQPASTWRRRRLCTRNSQSPQCSSAWNPIKIRQESPWKFDGEDKYLERRKNVMHDVKLELWRSRSATIADKCSWVFGDATNSAAALESISGKTQQTANICHFCHKCTTWFFYLGSFSVVLYLIVNFESSKIYRRVKAKQILTMLSQFDQKLNRSLDTTHQVQNDIWYLSTLIHIVIWLMLMNDEEVEHLLIERVVV